MAEVSTQSIFGKQLGRYILLEKLGEGGMATVYNAYDSRMERNVALKVILPSRENSQVFLERFVVEARAAAALAHTNIVKVLDYGEENGQPFLVMEYIRTGTLKEFMGSPMPYQQAAAILAPIARALDYVHKQKIIHRDVKPSNILIDDNDQPMLSDFGVVMMLESGASGELATGVGIGTPDYMSPEQGLGKEVDFRADIYALGVVFYEMLTGQKPYAAETPMAVVIKHVTGTFPRPAQAGVKLPPIVEEVVMKAVAKEPAKRYRDMGLFAEALEELARGEKARVKHIRRIIKLRENQRPPIRIRPMYLLLALLVLLVAAGSVLWSNSDAILRSPFGRTLISFVPAPVIALIPTETPLPAPSATATLPAPVVAVAQTAKPTASTHPTATLPSAVDPIAQPTSTLAAPGPAVDAPTPTAPPTAPPLAQPGNLRQNPAVDLPLIGTPIPSALGAFGGQMKKIALWGIGGVNATAWSPDGRWIAIGTTDGIFLYDSQTLERKLFIHTGEWVRLLMFSKDSALLTAGLRDGTLKCWSVADQAERYTIAYTKLVSDRIGADKTSPVAAIAYSPNERSLAVGYENGALSLWTLRDNTPTRVFTKEQPKKVTGLVFSADTRYLYGLSGETEMVVWDIAATQISDRARFSSPVTSLVLTPDGQYLLLGSPGGVVYLYDTIEERVIYSFPSLGAPVVKVILSPDSRTLAIGLANGKLKAYKLPNREEIKVFQKELYTIDGHPDAITDLVFSPNSATLASSSWRDGLKIWDAASGQPLKSLDQSLPPIRRMVFSPSARWLVVEDETKTIRIWDVASGKVIKTLSGELPDGNVFSTGGRYLLVFNEAKNIWDDGQLHVISHPSAETVITLTGHRRGWRTSFSPDDKLLVTASFNANHVWDTDTWERLMIRAGTENRCGTADTPDNQRLATVWTAAIIFNYADKNMEKLCNTSPEFATPLALLPDQSLAVFQLSNGGLWFWNFTTSNFDSARNTNSYQRNAGIDRLLDIVGKDRLYLYVRENDIITLSTTVSSSGIWTYPNRSAYQYQGAISPDRKIIALGSKFGTIELWAQK